ncbi:retron St85 family RNA-directed DNA polymerase [Methylomonas sp. MO1]|uniref:retron St85 family RNA-directed DNA polymerase n=1 Tax=Methylomonas sp. MO1 TaxID=3073619 RepID=UPI0028A4450E|nr:retron St85 family RNA-directed DNA polymerase [Methylomonas sp. MO1]MDT4289077.1 retron St85 family RNA-directed DNA polymerase [Methylomonas sp. MO1]
MQILQFLRKELSVTEREIKSFVVSAPKKYKVYTIPKKSSGTRVIAQPARRLKDYQRCLIKLLETKLPIHDAAFAYKKNIGIKENAERHKKSNYLLKMDFQNFFYSISPKLFFAVLKNNNIELTTEDRYLLEKILFFNPSKKTGGKLVLSIGAPSSPLVSNFIMYFFDESISKACVNLDVAYTRYADDLTFSSNAKNVLFAIPAMVKKTLRDHFNGAITVNEVKTVFSSKAHNRHVTGITITNENNLSIGRQRKRYISSLIHRFSINQLDNEDVKYLQGLLAFCLNVEPDFVERMKKKYSTEVLSAIQIEARKTNEKK